MQLSSIRFGQQQILTVPKTDEEYDDQKMAMLNYNQPKPTTKAQFGETKGTDTVYLAPGITKEDLDTSYSRYILQQTGKLISGVTGSLGLRQTWGSHDPDGAKKQAEKEGHIQVSFSALA